MLKLKKKQTYTALRKCTENPFLNLYEMDALTQSGKPFHYYFASRNKEEQLKLNTKSMQPEGIVIYPVCKEQPDKLVMIRQYRYPLDTWIYELPAGLVDAGETPGQAAARELVEETGYTFTEYTEGNPAFRRPYFLGAGMTDEMSATVYGYATGSSSQAYQEDSERIEVLLVDKQEAKRILSEERLSLRAGLLLIQFLQADSVDPFAFLRQ